jgi:hypothetical protein
MKITLLELFNRYPLTIKGIALRLGKSREWLSGVTYGRNLSNPDKKTAVLAEIQAEINQIGRQLAEIELIDDEK